MKCRLDVILFETEFPVVAGVDSIAVLIKPLFYCRIALELLLTTASPLIEHDLL